MNGRAGAGPIRYHRGMQVLLDGEPISVQQPTIAAALVAAKREAERRRRVVIEATMDGAPLADSWLEHPPTDARPGAEVRFVSADPLSLVRVTYLELAEELGAAAREQTLAAQAMQQGRLDEAMPRVSAALGVWQSVREGVVNGATLLGIDPAAMRVRATPGEPERTVMEHIDALARALAELKRAIGDSDWPGVADALEYDLKEQADRWRAVMNALADEIGRRAATGA